MAEAQRLRVVADRDVCIGAGNCVMVADRVFDQDPDDLTVIVLTEEVAAEDVSAVREAVGECPSGAISLEGDV
jgi:ferredoxin